MLTATKKRIHFLFDEFQDICVNVSGGKDSTVIFDLTYNIAKERNRLPIKCLWIDQEVEYMETERIIKQMMYKEGIEPYWMQMPILITNATSDETDYLDCWNPEKKDVWVREQDPISIKENTYGTKRFAELFSAISAKEFKNKTVMISGVRAEESPLRLTGLTCGNTYKGITYGRKNNKASWIKTIYPIYDWSYTDIWKYIHDNNLDYNRVYDAQYILGKRIQKMRISNLNHEKAVQSIFLVQQIEPETHSKITRRLKGTDSASKLGYTSYIPTSLPPMFKSWREYRNYLLEKLIKNKKHKTSFKKIFFRHDLSFENYDLYTHVLQGHVRAIVSNDWEGNSILADLWKTYENKVVKKVGYEQNRELRDKKIEYLKKTGVWKKLQEQQIVK